MGFVIVHTPLTGGGRRKDPRISLRHLSPIDRENPRKFFPRKFLYSFESSEKKKKLLSRERNVEKDVTIYIFLYNNL